MFSQQYTYLCKKTTKFKLYAKNDLSISIRSSIFLNCYSNSRRVQNHKRERRYRYSGYSHIRIYPVEDRRQYREIGFQLFTKRRPNITCETYDRQQLAAIFGNQGTKRLSRHTHKKKGVHHQDNRTKIAIRNHFPSFMKISKTNHHASIMLLHDYLYN